MATSSFAQWTKYNTTNSDLHSNNAIQLIADDDDNIWIALADTPDPFPDQKFEGLQKFDGTNWTLYDTSNVANFPIPLNYSSNFLEMAYHNGKIYIVNGPYNPGLYEFDIASETVTIHNSTNSINEFDHILIDDNGLIYLGEYNPVSGNPPQSSILSFDGSTWLEYPLANGSSLHDMELDGNGNVWATTSADELQKFDGSNWTVETSLPFTVGNSLQNMGTDQNNNVWISNVSPVQEMGEIAIWDGTTFDVYNFNNSGQDFRYVLQMIPDNNGNMWMSSGLGTVFSYDGSNWGRFDETNSNSTLENHDVRDIAVDNNNTKWILNNGLIKYTGGPGGTTNPSAPAAPTNLTATPTNSIELNWQDNANNEDGFKVEYALSNSGPWTEIADLGTDITTYTHTGLTTGVEYFYRVKAYNSNGESSFSNIASAVEGETGLAESVFKNTVVYPNPTSDLVTISNLPLGSKISLRDITGKLLFTSNATSEKTTLSMENFESNIYLLQIENNGSVSNRKIVVTR